MTMPEAEQIELIDAHPRLGAAPASMSTLSTAEQGHRSSGAPDGAIDGDRGIDADAAALDAELSRLNAAYEHRFGFRYCTFVAGRRRADLIPEFRAALRGERDAELRRGLAAVVAIAADRQRTLTGGST